MCKINSFEQPTEATVACYMQQQLLVAHLSHRNSVRRQRPSVCLSVHYTGGSVKNGAS